MTVAMKYFRADFFFFFYLNSFSFSDKKIVFFFFNFKNKLKNQIVYSVVGNKKKRDGEPSGFIKPI